MPKDEWKSTRDKKAMRKPKRKADSVFDKWKSIDDIEKMLAQVEQAKQEKKQQAKLERLAKAKAKPKKRRFKKSKNTRNFDRKRWSPARGCPRRSCGSKEFSVSYSHGECYRVSCCECGTYVKFVNPEHAGELIAAGCKELATNGS